MLKQYIFTVEFCLPVMVWNYCWAILKNESLKLINKQQHWLNSTHFYLQHCLVLAVRTFPCDKCRAQTNCFASLLCAFKREEKEFGREKEGTQIENEWHTSICSESVSLTNAFATLRVVAREQLKPPSSAVNPMERNQELSITSQRDSSGIEYQTLGRSWNYFL